MIGPGVPKRPNTTLRAIAKISPRLAVLMLMTAVFLSIGSLIFRWE